MESPANAKASFVVPCFNLGRYLDEAVESILAQTNQDFEILIVDDGSTDVETRRVLQDYRRPRTRVIRSENRGLPGAKNLGLAHTTGEWVCMLDADDRLDRRYLERSLEAAGEDPSLTFVSHWLQTFGDETWEWTPDRCDLAALLDINTVNGAALVRRSALETVGGFDETMRDGCEDWDLWITLVERGYQGRILPEVLFYYRRRADSMSRAMMQGDRHARLYRGLVEKHAASYRAHLDALVGRREAALSHLRLHTHDLDLEYVQFLAPDAAKWRSDVAMLERKTAQGAERIGPVASVEHLQSELAEARALVLELDAAAHRAREEAQGLRGSMSWRLTAPLRRVYGTAARLWGRARP